MKEIETIFSFVKRIWEISKEVDPPYYILKTGNFPSSVDVDLSVTLNKEKEPLVLHATLSFRKGKGGINA